MAALKSDRPLTVVVEQYDREEEEDKEQRSVDDSVERRLKEIDENAPEELMEKTTRVNLIEQMIGINESDQEERKQVIDEICEMYVKKDEPVDIMIKRIELDFFGKKNSKQ